MSTPKLSMQIRKVMPKREENKRIRRVEITFEADGRFHYSDDDIVSVVKTALRSGLLDNTEHALTVLNVEQSNNPTYRSNNSQYIGVITERFETNADLKPAEIARKIQKKIQSADYAPRMVVFDKRGKQHEVSSVALAVEAAKEPKKEKQPCPENTNQTANEST